MIIVIGANPAVNHPVAATFIKSAVKQRGAKLVMIDPRRQQLSRHAAYHLAFRPGSDVALLNALLHTIIEEELFDRQYVDAHTEGFAELRARIRDFAPERMEAVCGIPAATLREVARLYARARTAIIFWGMSIRQHVHGTDNSRCLIALALITGQIGRPDEVPDDAYPMVLSTGRVLKHWHTGSMTRRSDVLDLLEPEAVALLAPADLRRLGLAPGDRVRLETRRGTVDLKARADRDVPAGMVFLPFCYAEAAANLLTNPALDPFGKIPEFKFCAVRVSAAAASLQATS